MAGNGGIIGPVNTISAGNNKVTSITASGDITTQAGTRIVQALLIGAGGSGGNDRGGGGGS